MRVNIKTLESNVGFINCIKVIRPSERGPQCTVMQKINASAIKTLQIEQLNVFAVVLMFEIKFNQILKPTS